MSYQIAAAAARIWCLRGCVAFGRTTTGFASGVGRCWTEGLAAASFVSAALIAVDGGGIDNRPAHLHLQTSLNM